MIITRALYSLKTSGAAWRSMFAGKLMDLGYQSSKADPDVWIRAAMKMDGSQYYEMLLVYDDDILCISHCPERMMDQIKELYRLKDEVIDKPKCYLGANISECQLPNGLEAWSASAQDYIKNSVRNIEEVLAQDSLPSKLQNHID